ncbi:hypothetical protein BDK51DRAFT_47839 [Blyttiomyces helicus]|uniref:Uncharacterized protein n=1 Tax=Blyttiomyces helicus TaxID=388810 RepID=A0A4P9VVU8_9FUNG|nr:hypothetical protein BDK51DRAFT_47839 [Blyttiomyces helicus]|eukprot:RKO83801.1 hypothetical protein BDK51DRAFT_47839 [Blyttiomyces helicus]
MNNSIESAFQHGLAKEGRERAAPLLPLVKLDIAFDDGGVGGGRDREGNLSSEGGVVDEGRRGEAEVVQLAVLGVHVVIEGLHEDPGVGVCREEGILVGRETARGNRGKGGRCEAGGARTGVVGRRQEAVEGDAAIPVEDLLEDIVVEPLRGEVERREVLVRQVPVVGGVHAAEGVGACHDRHDLLVGEPHAAQLLEGGAFRVGGDREEVRRVRAGLAHAAVEWDLGAAAGIDGGDSSEVDRVREEDRFVLGVRTQAAEDRMGHVTNIKALVTDTAGLIDNATVETEGTVDLEPVIRHAGTTQM